MKSIRIIWAGFILVVFISLLSGCSGGSFQGYLVSKKENDDNAKIVVVKGITKEAIKEKSADELILEAAEKNAGHAFYTDKATYNDLEVGQKIRVYYKSDIKQESNPPIAKASKVQVLEE
ncbi:MAG TPA: DUF3221 domain-containing protein [Bacillus sp. (in: firmicutes)]|nr:DUF3221 domain-containing protein [Bacillus sp. (in: firmicutes)]